MQSMTGQTWAGGGNRGAWTPTPVNYKMGVPSTLQPPDHYQPNRGVENSGMTHMSLPPGMYPMHYTGPQSSPANTDTQSSQGGAAADYSVYPEQYTRAGKNWFQAQAVPAYNDLYSQWTQPGIAGVSPYQQWGMGAQAAQSVNQGANAAAEFGTRHTLSNLQNTLAQQMLADQMARMWGQAGYSDLALQQSTQQQQQATLADYLLSLATGWL